MELFGFTFTVPECVILLIASFLLGFAKTGIIGLGVITTPLFASVFPAGLSLGIAVPLSLVGDLLVIFRYRRKVAMQPLTKALPWGIAGTVGGWLFARLIARMSGPEADETLRTVIGFLMLFVVALGYYVSKYPHLITSGRSTNPELPAQPKARTWYAALLGVFAGFVAMLTNSGGAIWGLYFSSLGLEVKEIIGTSIWCFFILAIIKMPLGANLGFLNENTLLLNAVLIPVSILGIVVGSLVSGRVSKRGFAATIRILAACGAVYMLIS